MHSHIPCLWFDIPYLKSALRYGMSNQNLRHWMSHTWPSLTSLAGIELRLPHCGMAQLQVYLPVCPSSTVSSYDARRKNNGGPRHTQREWKEGTKKISSPKGCALQSCADFFHGWLNFYRLTPCTRLHRRLKISWALAVGVYQLDRAWRVASQFKCFTSFVSLWTKLQQVQQKYTFCESHVSNQCKVSYPLIGTLKSIATASKA